MAANDSWSDFENLRHTVKHNTVDKLKQILTGFNEECNTVFHKSGKKQDLIERIVQQLESWRQANNIDKWTKAKVILYQVRNTGMYTSSRMPGAMASQSLPSVPSAAYSSASNTARGSFNAIPAGRYDPYAPPRLPPPPTTGAGPSAVSKPGMRFKPSPFFRVDQAVSGIVECPESTSSTDRKQQTLTFTLTSEQSMKLNSTTAKFQLRLYCTSNTFYSSGFRPTMALCPIEFPPTCEVRVNGVQLTANLKGLKKKPGTAPPADLGRTVRTTGQNRVEMVYVNSQQPIQPKKFYLIVMLVEATTVEQLVDKLKKGKYRNHEDIVAQMNKTSSEDDDIIAGSQKMSLKCPLSFMRVATPCRSILCPHPQCFDATSWFSCMEQTTTWLCPVCEKALNFEDLIIDGYFDQILKDTSEDVEDVIVESDGQWHTSDNKFGSASWLASHPGIAPFRFSPSPRGSSPASVDEEAAAKAHARKNVEILVLDSDDEDEGRVKQELSDSYAMNTLSSPASNAGLPTTARQPRGGDVIDLTADSDEDEPQPPPMARSSLEKRKAPSGAPSPTEQIWKKSRVDSVPAPQQPQPPPQPQISHAVHLPPVSPVTNVIPMSTPRSPATAYPTGPSNYAVPQLPPVRYPNPSLYVPPVTTTTPHDTIRSPYDTYNPNSYYPSRPSGSTSRPGVWP
ncbi:PINIT domain-containing protein [Suillus placidus]|uniref:PINIT domain-containing protein n=1 Tax=Suillus placidus TaxID=48579 RepID=A0A9P7A7V1_9AGAM|nr:PINIT domain-containing protein [Suillus placidus]